MPTLSEWAKNETNMVKRGIMEAIITANEMNKFLEFKSIAGNALQYSRESTLPTATTHQVGDTWTDSEPTFSQKTAVLTTVGVQSPMDQYIAQTRNASNDPRAILYAGMAKWMGRKIADLNITGEPEATTTHWEGLDSLVRSETRMMAMDDGNIDGPGTAETELTLDRLDAMIDAVEEEGNKIKLIMNKTMRRKLTSLSRSSGSGVLSSSMDEFGMQRMKYGVHDIVICDFITNAETYNDAGTWPSSTATTIFAVVFGEADQGYTLLHNGPVLDTPIIPVGIKETKNEELYRMVAYLQAVVFSTKKIAALGGIDSQS